MDLNEKVVRTECQKCGKLLERDESIKTGGFCWKHKPRDMKPKKGKIVPLAGVARRVTNWKPPEKEPKAEPKKKAYKPDRESRKPKFPGVKSGKGYRWSREGLEDIVRLWNEKLYRAEKIAEDHNRPAQTVRNALKSFFILHNNLLKIKDDNHLPRYLRDVKEPIVKPVIHVKGPAKPERPVAMPKVEVEDLVLPPGPTPLEIIDKRINELQKRKNRLMAELNATSYKKNELETVRAAIVDKKHVTEV